MTLLETILNSESLESKMVVPYCFPGGVGFQVSGYAVPIETKEYSVKTHILENMTHHTGTGRHMNQNDIQTNRNRMQ